MTSAFYAAGRSRDASVETNNSNDVINENHQISQQKEVACIGETK